MSTKRKTVNKNKYKIWGGVFIIVIIAASALFIFFEKAKSKPLTQVENCKQVIEPRERHKAETAITDANRVYSEAIIKARHEQDYDVYKAQTKQITSTWFNSVGNATDTYTTAVKNAGCEPIDVSQFNVGGLPQ